MYVKHIKLGNTREMGAGNGSKTFFHHAELVRAHKESGGFFKWLTSERQIIVYSSTGNLTIFFSVSSNITITFYSASMDQFLLQGTKLSLKMGAWLALVEDNM